MNQEFAIALDAMGGDHGPSVVVPAAWAALEVADECLQDYDGCLPQNPSYSACIAGGINAAVIVGQDNAEVRACASLASQVVDTCCLLAAAEVVPGGSLFKGCIGLTRVAVDNFED